MQISKLERSNPMSNGKIEQKSISEKISGIAGKVLGYFVQNKYALAVSVWSCALIEISIATSDSIVSGNYVYDVASCRRTLCDYATQHAQTNYTTEESFNLVETCTVVPEDFSYSFMDCLHELCTFLGDIGEKFYACVGNFSREDNVLTNQILSDTKIPPLQFWSSVCPKRHLKHLTDFKKLSYFKDCLENICKDSRILNLLNEDTLSLCNDTSVRDIHNTLKIIKKYLRKLTKAAENQEGSQQWDKSNAITNIVIAITGIISSAAAVATTIIACRTGSRFSVAVKKTSDSLSFALQNLNLYTKSSVKALTEQVLHVLSDTLPISAIESLQVLSEIMQEESSVYYSAAEGGSVNLKGGNPRLSESSLRNVDRITSGVHSAAKSVIGTSGSQALGFAKTGDTASKILKTGLGVLGAGKEIASETVHSTVGDFLDTLTDKEEILSSTVTSSSNHDYCIKHYTSESSLSLSIVNLWVDCLKDSLPNWDEAYCFYNRAINFLACRLPSSAPKKDFLISFPSIDMHKFFYENTETLCHIFNEAIWCNWNKFLDLSFFKRSISFFYDEECPWDQFALHIPEVTDNVYKVEAIGGCYNQTALIKV